MKMGLRAKSVMVLGACMAAVLLVSVVAGERTLSAVEENLGAAFARNATQLNKQRILAPVGRELVLSQRLADSELTQRWLLDESDPAKKALFFAEAERYKSAFADKSYFAILRDSRHYYYNDDKAPFSDRPKYSLNPQVANDAWFFNTMKKKAAFNINVDPDVKLKVTKVWFNVLVKNNGRNIGLVGTGLDLTTFLQRFITSSEAGVTPLITNRAGAIQAHPNPKLIDYASVNDKGAQHSTIYRLLSGEKARADMREALDKAEKDPESVPEFWAQLDGKRQLFAVSYLPELSWFVVSAVDVKAAQVIDMRVLAPFLVGSTVLLLLLVAAIMLAINRILLAPLLRLTGSVREVARGNYAVQMPPAGGDEMGELTRAFGTMAAQVRSHTDELEGRVQERTKELVAAGQQIGDSIRAASLIQGAILPDHELSQSLQGQHFVLWRPRDVVGGDFYVFRATPKGALMGIVDCAGHGVPGAFMTMIAYAVLNVAIDSGGARDPASLLAEMDARLRAMLHNDPKYSQVATNMDVGLAYVDFERKNVTFAGAKVSLYWCDGQKVEEVKGDRAAIGGKRIPTFSNRVVPLAPRATFYLTTDGLLDQGGGEKGFSFGQERFNQLLMRLCEQPLPAQRAAFDAELSAYRGDLAQRDDITVMGFRFAD